MGSLCTGDVGTNVESVIIILNHQFLSQSLSSSYGGNCLHHPEEHSYSCKSRNVIIAFAAPFLALFLLRKRIAGQWLFLLFWIQLSGITPFRFSLVSLRMLDTTIEYVWLITHSPNKITRLNWHLTPFTHVEKCCLLYMYLKL